jgi:hypothetical protein
LQTRGACGELKIIFYMPAGVTGGALLADWLLRPIELWRIALTGAVALIASILLSATLRIGTRKKTSAPVN